MTTTHHPMLPVSDPGVGGTPSWPPPKYLPADLERLQSIRANLVHHQLATIERMREAVARVNLAIRSAAKKDYYEPVPGEERIKMFFNAFIHMSNGGDHYIWWARYYAGPRGDKDKPAVAQIRDPKTPNKNSHRITDAVLAKMFPPPYMPYVIEAESEFAIYRLQNSAQLQAIKAVDKLISACVKPPNFNEERAIVERRQKQNVNNGRVKRSAPKYAPPPEHLLYKTAEQPKSQ